MYFRHYEAYKRQLDFRLTPDDTLDSIRKPQEDDMPALEYTKTPVILPAKLQKKAQSMLQQNKDEKLPDPGTYLKNYFEHKPSPTLEKKKNNKSVIVRASA